MTSTTEGPPWAIAACMAASKSATVSAERHIRLGNIAAIPAPICEGVNRLKLYSPP
ncbi:Uncharacterised protein [Mycobacteroides abscessus subsp. massiliense]|nr:Uncharacterised protein [Mycobacteroides abscessus subsp. massiliense]